MANMATDELPAAGTHEREQESLWLGMGGLMMEGLGGTAIVLSILGLLEIFPVLLASIATIVVGVSFLIAGSAMASRLARFGKKTETLVARLAIGEGMAAESLTGAVGAVLGILALLGSGATTLLPVAAIVYGAGLLAGSGAAAQLKSLWEREHTPESRTETAAGPGVLIALSGIVLGNLGLAHLDPIILSLAAMLSFGVAVVLRGTALARRLLAIFS